VGLAPDDLWSKVTSCTFCPPLRWGDGLEFNDQRRTYGHAIEQRQRQVARAMDVVLGG
jgi:hypothetical protein